jgi:lipid-A-disaccharide synthase
MTGVPLTLAIVAGEQSGENLAVDLVESIAEMSGQAPRLVGVGGTALAALGLRSVFDPDEIAITGVTAVAMTLPRILLRIRQTADAIIAGRPNAVVMIDSPDFSHRVARRVRSALPGVPIFKYVAPTVWAWRPGRAAAMRSSFDHVLAILPFEPEVMKRLHGPATHYVGHPLAADDDLLRIQEDKSKQAMQNQEKSFELLILPGSRKGELKALLGDFGAAVALLHERGNRFCIHMPTLPRLADMIKDATAAWPISPKITTTREEKLTAFAAADVALAASGTVILELALAGIPSVSCYRSDLLIKPFIPMIKTWSAALPNLIADKPLVPEYIDYLIRPGMLARQLEVLADRASSARHFQVEGFEEVRRLLTVEEPPGRKAAKIVLEAIG